MDSEENVFEHNRQIMRNAKEQSVAESIKWIQASYENYLSLLPCHCFDRIRIHGAIIYQTIKT